MLLNKLGRKDETEALLREVVNVHPELYEVQYSLGLLLAEKKLYDEAAGHLEIASQGLPGRARIRYNLGLLLQHLKRDPEAEAALLGALEIEPNNLDYLYALADFYLKRGNLTKARILAEQMVAKHPRQSVGQEILNFINDRMKSSRQP